MGASRESRRPLGVTVAGVAAVIFVACAYKLAVISADLIEMRDWVPTSALVQNLDPTPGLMAGSLHIAYVYTNGQRTCKGSRVNVMENAGASDGDRFRVAFTQGKAITIWVDPDEKCRAVIDRDVPWLAVILLAAGIAVTAGAVLSIRKRGWKLM
ncbi:DUF3592 domain-containing protein [Usitatibacter palustris]|uniref:DUF3592 domain-containing protein n=1 Tax=Usitatibacter palustris TaxID=2732487 RepID=A0A6M4H5H6_9PROT|nr:DUF3592 domain-containing protein [Usitatibacter palustris]QJR14901.1 hypothetical protein DSM104440_01716 [Usitatibacter palustris]